MLDFLSQKHLGDLSVRILGHRNPVAIFTSNRNLGRILVADEFLVKLFCRFGRESETDKVRQETRHTPDSHLMSFPSCDKFPVSNMNSAIVQKFHWATVMEGGHQFQ